MEKYQNTINYIDYLFDLSSFYSTALALKPAEIGNVEVHLGRGELPHVMSGCCNATGATDAGHMPHPHVTRPIGVYRH